MSWRSSSSNIMASPAFSEDSISSVRKPSPNRLLSRSTSASSSSSSSTSSSSRLIKQQQQQQQWVNQQSLHQQNRHDDPSLILSLQAEIDRLKQKLNTVITSAEESLQSAFEAQEEVKDNFQKQQEKLLTENSMLLNDNAKCREVTELAQKELILERNKTAKAMRYIERLRSRGKEVIPSTSSASSFLSNSHLNNSHNNHTVTNQKKSAHLYDSSSNSNSNSNRNRNASRFQFESPVVASSLYSERDDDVDVNDEDGEMEGDDWFYDAQRLDRDGSTSFKIMLKRAKDMNNALRRESEASRRVLYELEERTKVQTMQMESLQEALYVSKEELEIARAETVAALSLIDTIQLPRMKKELSVDQQQVQNIRAKAASSNLQQQLKNKNKNDKKGSSLTTFNTGINNDGYSSNDESHTDSLTNASNVVLEVETLWDLCSNLPFKEFLETLVKRVAESREEILKKREELGDIKSQYDSKIEANGALEKELSASVEKMTEIELQFSITLELANNREVELSEKGKLINELNENISANQKIISLLEVDLQVTREQNNNMIESNSMLSNEIEQLKISCNELNQTLVESSTQFHEENLKLKNQINLVQEQYSSSQENLSQAEFSLNEQSERIENLEFSNLSLTEKIKVIETQSAKDLNILQNRYNSMVEDNQNMKITIFNLESRLKETDGMSKAQQSRIEILRQDLRRNQEDLEKKTLEYDVLSAKLEQARQDLLVSDAQLLESEGVVGKLKMECDDTLQKLLQKEKALETCIETSASDVEALKREHSCLSANLQDEISSLKEALSRVMEEAKRKDDVHNIVTAENEQRLIEFQKENDDAKKALDNMSQYVSKMEAEILINNNKISSLQADLSSAHADIKLMNSEHNDEVSGLQNELNSFKNDYKSICAEKDDLSSSLQSFQSRNMELDSINDDLKCHLNALQNEMKNNIALHNSKMDSLQNEKEDVENILSSTERNVEELKNTINEMANEIKRLNNDILLITTANSDTNENLRIANLRINELEDDLGDAGEELVHVRNDFTLVQMRLNQTLSEFEQDRRSINEEHKIELNKSRDQYEVMIETNKQILEVKSAEMESNIKSILMQKDVLTRDAALAAAAASAAIESLENARKDLQCQLEIVKSELFTKETELSSKESELQIALASGERIRTIFADETNTASSLASVKYNQLEAEHNITIKQLDELRKEFENNKKDTESARLSYEKELSKVVEETNAAALSATATHNKLKADYLITIKKIDEMKKDYDASKRELESAKVTHEAELRRFAEEMNASLSSAALKYNQLEADHNITITQFDEMRKEFEVRIKEAEIAQLSSEKELGDHLEQIALLNTASSLAALKYNQLEAEYNTTVKQLDEIKKDVEICKKDAESTRLSHEKELSKLVGEKNAISLSALTEYNKLASEYQTLSSQLEDAEKHNDTIRRGLESMKLSYEKELRKVVEDSLHLLHEQQLKAVQNEMDKESEAIKFLSQNLQEMRAELATKQNEITALMLSSSKERDILKDEATVAAVHAQKLQDEIKLLAERGRESDREREREREKLQESSQLYKITLEAKESDCRQLMAFKEESIIRTKELDVLLADSRASCESKQASIDHLTALLESTKSHLDGELQKQDQLGHTLMQMGGEYSEAKVVLESHVSELLEKVRSLEEKIEMLELDQTESKHLANRLQDEIDDKQKKLQKQSDEMQYQQKESAAALMTFSEKAASTVLQMHDLSNKLAQCKAQLQESNYYHEGEVAKIKDEILHSNASTSAIQTALIEDLNQQLSELRECNESITQENESLREEIENMQLNYTSTVDALNSARSEAITNAMTKESQARSEVVAALQRESASKAEINALINRENQLKFEISQRENQIVSEIGQLKDEIEQTKSELKAMTEKNNELVISLDKEIDARKYTEAISTSVGVQFESLKQEYRDLNALLEKTKKESVEKMKAITVAKDSEKFSELKRQHEVELNDLRQALSNYDKEMEKSKYDAAKLKTDKVIALTDLQNAKNIIAEKESRIDALKLELRKEQEATRERDDEMQRAILELEASAAIDASGDSNAPSPITATADKSKMNSPVRKTASGGGSSTPDGKSPISSSFDDRSTSTVTPSSSSSSSSSLQVQVKKVDSPNKSLVSQIDDLTKQLAIARKNAKTSTTTAQKAASAAAIELRSVRTELADMTERYLASIQANEALIETHAIAEREYNSAASHLIATVESHRQNQQTKIDDLKRKLSLALSKLKSIKERAKNDRHAHDREIEELRRRLLQYTTDAPVYSHPADDDAFSDNESEFSIVSEIHNL